ncbi:MAG: hypothetical protein JSS39_03490 [Nitrospira sp.]|nr:hypothetical protein [Nitrospira sp.]
MVEKVNSAVIQLGRTPRYLDVRCHEALYEVDVGVNEVSDLLDGNVAREEGSGVRGMQMSRTCA